MSDLDIDIRDLQAVLEDVVRENMRLRVVLKAQERIIKQLEAANVDSGHKDEAR
jgi:hypothetical protein